VLVALAVIFIPMLLPGKGDLSNGINGSNIPPEPDFRFPPVPVAPKAPPVAAAPAVPLGDDDSDVPATPAPAEKVAIKSSTKAEPASKEKPKALAKSRPKSAAKSQPIAKSTPPPVTKKSPAKTAPQKGGSVKAWVVQVGSFSARKNARGLRDKLRNQGYSSFVESINNGSGRVYRVRVGPELTKSTADKLRKQLAKEAGLKGLVQSYP